MSTGKASKSDWKDGFLFVGNQLALDFLNTRPVQNGEPLELLPDFSALLRWFQAADLLSSREVTSLQRQWGESASARRTMEAMRELREKLREEILAWEGSGVGSSFHTGRTEYADDRAPHAYPANDEGASRTRQSYGSNRANRKICLRRWRTVRRHYSRPRIRSASASVPSAWCISMTSARRGRDAGAACRFVGIG